MTAPDLLAVFLDRFNQSGIEYMVTGSVASTLYGEPRLTQDVDLVVRLGPGDGRRLFDAFPAAAFYAPPVEVLEEEARRPNGGHFNLLHLDTGLRADCYLVGDSELNRWGFAHRRGTPVAGRTIWVAPPEYVIVFKLDFFRQSGGDKHLDDIARMLRVSGDQIRAAEIAGWVRRLRLEPEWDRAQERLRQLGAGPL